MASSLSPAEVLKKAADGAAPARRLRVQPRFSTAA